MSAAAARRKRLTLGLGSTVVTLFVLAVGALNVSADPNNPYDAAPSPYYAAPSNPYYEPPAVFETPTPSSDNPFGPIPEAAPASDTEASATQPADTPDAADEPAATSPVEASPVPALATAAIVAAPDSGVESPREWGLLAAMNSARIAAGLQPLTFSPTLTSVGRMRSLDMLTRGYFAHFGPTGQSAYSLLAQAGMRFSAGGENLAKVAGDVDGSVNTALNALLRSPSHRANILNPRFTQAGVGAATDSSGVTIFTTIFTD